MKHIIRESRFMYKAQIHNMKIRTRTEYGKNEKNKKK